MSESPKPEFHEQEPRRTEQQQIGTDEWVAQVEERRLKRGGISGALAEAWERIPRYGRLGLGFLLLLIIPTITGSAVFLEAFEISSDAFILRIGVRFLNFAMLAIGLNVIVGFAGLLDLGYIAYMGIAGYLYAYMSSEFVHIRDIIPNGLATPAIISLPLIMVIVAIIGWIIGSISIRLAGDYFAIVTLGFGLVFEQLARTATRVKLPWLARPVDLTRGPNGINRLDGLSFFGFNLETTEHYYYLFLLLVILLFIIIDNLNHSRIGRSWRAIRDDELGAELMSIPTRRMKILAVVIGAAIAALAGATDAAFQTNVVPTPRYSALTLINLYAMVVLGGMGSLPGAILGAFIFATLPEALRSIELAGYLFYGVGLLLLFSMMKTRRFALILGVTVVGGFVLKLAINLLAPELDTGFPEAGSVLNEFVQGWLVIPKDFRVPGNIATGLTMLCLLLTAVSKPPYRWIVMSVMLYLAAFAWETRLAIDAGPTRILIIGFTLVLLMIFRPHGLLGKPEVKVV